jgi:hypothetical protein
MIGSLNKITSLLIFALLILGIFMIGSGITGKVILDNNTVKDICSTNSECKTPLVCCYFYNKNQGICHEQNMCEIILKLTKDENNNIEILKSKIYENPTKEKLYTNEIVLGIGIIVIILIFAFFSYFSRDKNIKRTIKKK